MRDDTTAKETRLCEYEVTWRCRVSLDLPLPLDSESMEAYDMAAEKAGDRINIQGPDDEDVECILDVAEA